MSGQMKRPDIPNDNAGWLAAFGEHLIVRPARTREAYQRDVAQLVRLAGDAAVARLTRLEVSRLLARLHAQGLSGVSLRRKLSAWRAFYGFVRDRDPSVHDDPCAGLRAPKARIFLSPAETSCPVSERPPRPARFDLMPSRYADAPLESERPTMRHFPYQGKAPT